MKPASYSLIIMSILTLGCQKVKDEATESVTNTVIEKALDYAVSAPKNIEQTNKNNAKVAIDLNGEKLFSNTDHFKSIVNISGKRMIVFSIDAKDAKINISFSGLGNMLESKPITGINKKGQLDPKIAKETVATVSMVKENNFLYSLMDGKAVISKFTQDEIKIEFSGKAGTSMDANSPEKWKPIHGEIICNYPVINALQVKAEDIYY